MWRLFVGFICFFSLALHAAQRDNLSTWFVDSLVKVFPDTPAATSKLELALVSARNRHVSLQVALRSEEHRGARVRVIAPRLGYTPLQSQTYRLETVELNPPPTSTPLPH